LKQFASFPTFSSLGEWTVKAVSQVTLVGFILTSFAVTLWSIPSGSTHLDRRFDWADAARPIRAHFGAAMFLAPAAARP
jgi:hypothetical protein